MLESNSQLGQGGAGMHGSGSGSAAAMIKELQGLTTKVLTGAAANTNIAVAGIATEDTIQSAILFTAGVPSDITANAAITSAGNVQFTSDTSGKQVVLTYFNKK
jgi:hypothetical protein